MLLLSFGLSWSFQRCPGGGRYQILYNANEKATELAEEEIIVTKPSKEEVEAQKVDRENEGK